MTELKTLKDIKCEHAASYDDCSCVCTMLKEPLRKEAIKWVKEFRHRKLMSLDTFTGDGKARKHNLGYDINALRLSAIIDSWMHIFNLTEDDLK